MPQFDYIFEIDMSQIFQTHALNLQQQHINFTN